MKNKLIITFFAIFILNLLVYQQVINNPFVSDDYDLLNVAANSTADWHDYLTGNYYGEHGVGGSFRPMIIYLLKAEYFFFGLNSAPYHLISILLNSINAFLVCLLAIALFKNNQNKWLIGGIAGIIFTALPFHTEVVAWIAAQGDLAATLFYLASLLFFIFAANNKLQISNSKIPARPAGGQSLNSKENLNSKTLKALSLFFFFLALLTKETALTLPIVLFFYLFFNTSVINLKAISYNLKATLGYWILGIGYLFYRNWAIGLLFGYYGETHLQIRIWDYLQTASNLFWNVFVFGSWRGLIGNSIIGVVLFCGFFVFSFFRLWKKKRNTQLFIFLFWLINILLILPLTLHPHTNEGERYGYLPSVAVAILLSTCLYSLWIKRKIYAGLLLSAIIIYSSITQVLRIQEWKYAGRVAQAITQQLLQFDYQSYKKTFIIGLPQSYHGAPIMRNGVPQMLKLSNIDGEVERVPVFLKDGLGFNNQLYDKIEIKPDGILARSVDNNYIFEGKATEDLPEYKYELWGYDYAQSLAPNIRLQFQGGREYDWARGEIQILYWDEGKFKVTVNE